VRNSNSRHQAVVRAKATGRVDEVRLGGYAVGMFEEEEVRA
jgi:hypothetical protein